MRLEYMQTSVDALSRFAEYKNDAHPTGRMLLVVRHHGGERYLEAVQFSKLSLWDTIRKFFRARDFRMGTVQSLVAELIQNMPMQKKIPAEELKRLRQSIERSSPSVRMSSRGLLNTIWHSSMMTLVPRTNQLIEAAMQDPKLQGAVRVLSERTVGQESATALFQQCLATTNKATSIEGTGLSECTCCRYVSRQSSTKRQELVQKIVEKVPNGAKEITVVSFNPGRCLQELRLHARLFDRGYTVTWHLIDRGFFPPLPPDEDVHDAAEDFAAYTHGMNALPGETSTLDRPVVIWKSYVDFFRFLAERYQTSRDTRKVFDQTDAVIWLQCDVDDSSLVRVDDRCPKTPEGVVTNLYGDPLRLCDTHGGQIHYDNVPVEWWMRNFVRKQTWSLTDDVKDASAGSVPIIRAELKATYKDIGAEDFAKPELEKQGFVDVQKIERVM